ncbi:MULTISPECIES: ribonuclease P protein component 1 [unclassified Halorhabdus]|uniref:ribonuclease P protein component 1 n=1 Tax=unclassified Halorhabdus TaxID=2621901 RepID=UPI0023DB225F|nr:MULTISPECIES: ribonuclease P protein component 1 [unclassified Halorhabdus]WEL18425.1 RNase P/RNase MRP subunit p29 [Halorhabdus sp. SVX81]WEL22308.1 RNase P/RNase MRP subunit p29 [Halorhabdus sp. BNX81]
MPLTPDTLARHELIGLPARVSAATNADLVGIDGTVVDETAKTLSIERGGRTWQVPKATATVEFTLSSDDPAATDGELVVTVDGNRLVAPPARRTERRGDSTWR